MLIATRILCAILILAAWTIAFLADVVKLEKEDRDNWGVFAQTVTIAFGLVFLFAGEIS